LDAEAPDLIRLVLARVVRLAAAGAAARLLVSILAARAMRSLLYGVAPNDPATIAAAIALVLALAFLASILPTRRAVRIDPMTALREE
jgi:putative ABC transport system permease protein